MERRRILRIAYTAQLFLAVLSLVYVAVAGLTAIGMNHRHGLRLDRVNVGRPWLPSSYRAGQAAVPADQVVADVHGALLFSPSGAAIVDATALFWAISLAGEFLYRRRQRQANDTPLVLQRANLRHMPGDGHGLRRKSNVIQFHRD